MSTRAAAVSPTEESRLTVIFGGSCGFVPHTDGTKIRVLLPKGRPGWVATDGKTIVPPHRAIMKFRMSDLAEGSPRQPDFVYDNDGEAVGVCFLSNETLSLPKSLDPTLFLNATALKNKAAPAPADSRSVEWIAQTDDLCSDPKFDAQYLTEKPPTTIAAMLDISSGIMESHFVPAEQFDFDPPLEKGVYRQCLAGQVSLSTRVSGRRPEIASKGGESLRLKALDWEARVEILNEVLEDVILGYQYRRPKAKKDFDFELLYDLTKADPKHWHLPLNLSFNPQADDWRNHDTSDCKPKLFAAKKFPVG